MIVAHGTVNLPALRKGRAINGWHFSHFESPALAPLTMQRNGRKMWTPRAPGIMLRPILDAPAPADTVVKRQSQMRRLAERFEVTDDFHPIYTDPKTERHTLRLLTKPLYRYEATGDLID
jgi:hypothetical protein